MSAVQLRGVTLAVAGRTLLSQVELTVRDAEFVGVLGPNGAGKTTLMRAILGLIAPAAGEIRVLDRPVVRGNPAVGYLPQVRSQLTFGRLSGWDLLAGTINGHRWGLPWPKAALRRQIQSALSRVGAESLARRPLAELSGGERQRVLLAQALLGEPRLLMLDEPLISLDPPHQRGVVELVRELQREHGISVLFSAHEINPLLNALDRVLYLGNGQAALGTVDEIITGPSLSRLYGSQVEVVRVGERLFVMSGSHEIERDEHRHGGHGGHESAHGDRHSHA